MIEMSKARKIDIDLETGPLQFNDDWPGVFIRGDNAIYYATQISQVIQNMECESGKRIAMFLLNGLCELLQTSRV